MNVVAFGLGSASDTLGAQAFGSKNKHLVGLALQRGIAQLAPLITITSNMVPPT